MSRKPLRQFAVLPLLDRLIDDDPFSSAEASSPLGMNEPAIASAIRDAIRRDLEVLLNTRQRLVNSLPEGFEPPQSIVDYGLPAERGTNLATPSGQSALCGAIEGAIRRFEPRLQDVEVSLEQGETAADPLRLAIAAKVAGGSLGEPWRLRASWAGRPGPVTLEEAGS
jgi:type VI secretion system protein ImpF